MRASILALSAAAILGTAGRAHAFCGFYVGGAGVHMYNNATEVVLMRHGTTTILSMENNYQGPPAGFAMVVPVPVVLQQSQVKTLDHAVFDKIDTLGAPRLVEYWEQDPCYQPPPEEPGAVDEDEEVESVAKDDDGDAADQRDYHVKVEARFTVGEYDIEMLSAQQSTGLERWLHDHHYTIPPNAEPLLRPYVEQGMKWFVAKVDPKKVKFANGMATLSPLRFYYDSPVFSLPIRLGLANSKGTQDLIVNILAPNTRYEVANYPNVTIPTNLQVTDAVRTHFAEFYAALFDHTLEQVPNAVVTEYAWDSGSCDPCPGPTLDADDLATLGADVINQSYKDATYASYTLTRLHARYGKDLHDDLMFRAVEPIVGGRGIPDANGAMSTAVTRDTTNNFQGRYAILHPWTGAVTCAAPRRGVWGGPPAGQQIATQAATNTAFAPRGNVQLTAMVATPIPGAGAMASSGNALPIPVRQPEGCGCEADGGAAGLAMLGAFGMLGLITRRRRRARGVFVRDTTSCR